MVTLYANRVEQITIRVGISATNDSGLFVQTSELLPASMSIVSRGQITPVLTAPLWRIDVPRRQHQGFGFTLCLADSARNMPLVKFGPRVWSLNTHCKFILRTVDVVFRLVAEEAVNWNSRQAEGIGGTAAMYVVLASRTTAVD